MEKKFRVKSFSLLFGFFCAFLSCSKTGSVSKIDLTEYFEHYPAITETHQIVFSEEDFSSYLLEGWTNPRKKPSSPFMWALRTGSSLRIFLSKKKEYKMHIRCRAKNAHSMNVTVNGNPVSSLQIKEGKNFHKVIFPERVIRQGLNIINFFYSPLKETAVKRDRIAFQKLDFIPIEEKEDIQGIQIDQKKKSINLHGPLACTFLVRTYENSRITFQCRTQDKISANVEIRMTVENYLGQKQKQNISVPYASWEKEEMDLESFPNQLVRVSFHHFAGGRTLTEIKDPVLIPGEIPSRRKKILLLGLDGLAWEILSPLLKQGKLPNFKKLIESGASGRLRTVRPMYSPLIWTTIVTGKVKEKHGIAGYIEQRRKKGEIILNSRLNRKVLAIWNILSEEGYPVGIVGPWITWPAEAVNGYLLSDRIYFENLSTTTFPLELKRFLKLKIKPFVSQEQSPVFSSIDKMLTPANLRLRSSIEKNVKQEKMYLQQDHLKRRAGLYFNEIFRPEFFFLYLRGPDVTGHFFWKYFEPDKAVPGEEIKAFKDVIPSIYLYQDYVVGQYLDRAGPDTTVIIVSDHGMARKSYGQDIIFSQIHKLWEKTGLSNHILNTSYKQNQLELTLRRTSDPKTIKSLISEIRLEKRKNPLFRVLRENGNNRVSLEVNNAFLLDGKSSILFYQNNLGILEDFATIKEISGDHTPEGVLIISGPGIKKNFILKKCSVLDVTPTILHLMGLPVGEDMDGDVIKEAFTKQFLIENPVRTIKSYEDKIRKQARDKKQLIRDKALEKDILERLKALGYIK